MDWSPQQVEAIEKARAWLDTDPDEREQVFTIFGYAGTGKTTIAKALVESVKGQVLFAAFTGKAALVLSRKGCPASTIHSLIYKPKMKKNHVVGFRLNVASEVRNAKLVVVDEVSMVGEALGSDLLSFGTPVMVLGDPAQLPPVKDAGFFITDRPDVMLTEVHRQAQGNPIINMAMTVREGKKLRKGKRGESRVIAKAQVDRQEILTCDQVLVGRNETRRLYNARMRHLLGRNPERPEIGDKLICLRNRHGEGLLNGSTWIVTAVEPDDDGFGMIVVAEEKHGDPQAQGKEIYVRREFFEGREDQIPAEKRRESHEFDYGYAITVHKSQGSQWDHVVLFDESAAFRDDWSKWLYTGLTRAAERITVVAG